MPLGQVQVPFPDSSSPGMFFHPQESGGRIINGYVEPLGPAAPSRIIYRRAPGNRTFGTTTRTGFRGAIEVQGLLYCAFAQNLVTLTSAGGAASNVTGTLTGTAKGFFARNNLQPTADKVFVDPDGNAFVVTSSSITSGIPGLVPAPNSVCSIDGFFIFTIGDGRVFASDLNSTTVNPLSFGTAENKPDGLTRGIPWAGNLFLFGPATTEVWSNVGTTPFPFQRSVVIPRGIAGPYCVAGFEDNFSRALVWVADDNTVVRLNGYTPEKISPPDLDGLIERVTNKRDLEMSVYMARGHAFVLLSSPTWSWVFDLNNDKWAERNSWLQPRSRITGGVFAFNKWLCGDLLSNNILEITNQVHTEAPRSQLITGAVAGDAGRVRLTVGDTSQMGGDLIVQGVAGTTEANGIWTPIIVDDTHIELTNSVFAHTYTSGGTVTDVVAQPFRWRLESGAVENFPVGARVGRFDCEFVTGVGTTTHQHDRIAVIGPSGAGAFGEVAIHIANTSGLRTGDVVRISGVLGTTEANGVWTIYTFPGSGGGTLIQLQGSHWVNPYISGGIVEFLTPLDPIETDPVVEISWSDDGGYNYYAPIRRKLGSQSETRELVSLISCTGRSGWTARRWRLDISDPVHVGFMAAYQQLSPKVSDIG